MLHTYIHRDLNGDIMSRKLVEGVGNSVLWLTNLQNWNAVVQEIDDTEIQLELLVKCVQSLSAPVAKGLLFGRQIVIV